MNEQNVHDAPAPAVERRPPSYLRQVRRGEPHATMQPQPSYLQTARKVTACVVWFGACYTTWQTVSAIGVTSVIAAVGVTLIVQAILTVLESPFWSGKWYHPIPLAAVIADTIINAGGLWNIVERLDRIPFWVNLVEGFGLQPGMRPVPVTVLSLLFGFLLAFGPESLWKYE